MLYYTNTIQSNVTKSWHWYYNLDRWSLAKPPLFPAKAGIP